ncbi:MAG TPA: PKD domain-containing protein, partial [Chitinophagales bacterium]|nr:PKD domain-containing protein [Chitinophagales bacterium]
MQNQSYQGSGNVEDLPDGTSCLQNEENNSVWYIFTVTISGVLHFSIIPQASDDYDFALYNLTGSSCAAIGSGGLEVRCNYAFTNGPTGIGSGGTNAVEGPGGQPFCSPLNVTVGETYALLVDNFSSTQFGYTLDFNPNGASTASIIDFLPPEITGTDTLTCTDTDSITVFFSEPILCSFIAVNGSDFQVTGPSPVTITSAYSTACAGGSFTLSAVIRFSSPINVGGNYSLILRQGTDGGTVEDNCGNQAVRDTIPFFVPNKVQAGFTFTQTSGCASDTFNFTSTSAGNIATFAWDFGDSSSDMIPNPVHIYSAVGTYTVTLTVSSA